ncbi:MAG: hypothetical protein MZV64_43815 [Ignavibacteriales bacterium]|nr:hypothetical protein [Ignavibacteriales bacterium]
MHAIVETDADARVLVGEVPALAKRGVNLLIAEVDYAFEYVSHPELRTENPVRKDTVKAPLAACRAWGIRLVPQFQSLGHQSWEKKTSPLLVKYPHLDETPAKYPDNTGRRSLGNGLLLPELDAPAPGPHPDHQRPLRRAHRRLRSRRASRRHGRGLHHRRRRLSPMRRQTDGRASSPGPSTTPTTTSCASAARR